MAKYKAGILYGDDLNALFDDAKQNQFALPAINVFNTNSINAALETAAEVNSPVVIQLSVGSSQFIAGKKITDQIRACTLGAISGALHVHTVASHYGVPVVLHTDHASKEWLPWIDALISEGETFKRKNGTPLFSSHMLDLSKESLSENIGTSAQYFKRLQNLGMGIEMELGITGGEEEGIDNSGVENLSVYTQPAAVANAYETLRMIDRNFLIAAAFGNVHGVYNPEGIELRPEILKESQAFVKEKFLTEEKPVRFVFHGGSGTPKHQMQEAIAYGVVKVNIDTDLQWAFWKGVRDYYENNAAYLQSQLGNPEGKEMPNKKYYEAKIWLRQAEKGFIARLTEAFMELNCIDRSA